MVKKSQFEMLERISGYTAEQAKSYLLNELESQLTHEKAVRILEYEQQLKDESEQKARNIISLAIQRCAADHVAEATVSVVPLPQLRFPALNRFGVKLQGSRLKSLYPTAGSTRQGLKKP